MTEISKNWLKDAHYKYDRRAILPYLDLFIPNSGNEIKQQRYRGKNQCHIIECLLMALDIPGETLV